MKERVEWRLELWYLNSASTVLSKPILRGKTNVVAIIEALFESKPTVLVTKHSQLASFETWIIMSKYGLNIKLR